MPKIMSYSESQFETPSSHPLPSVETKTCFFCTYCYPMVRYKKILSLQCVSLRFLSNYYFYIYSNPVEMILNDRSKQLSPFLDRNQKIKGHAHFLLHLVNPMGLISAKQLVPFLEEINPVTFPGNIFQDLRGNDIDHT